MLKNLALGAGFALVATLSSGPALAAPASAGITSSLSWTLTNGTVPYLPKAWCKAHRRSPADLLQGQRR